jgi:NADH-quinone oxidoreductase subunit C
MAHSLVTLLQQHHPDAVLATDAQCGDETVVLQPARWREVARFLRDAPESRLQMLVDLTAVDDPERSPRFTVVVHLLSLELGHRLRLKARVDAEIESLATVWASANWLERECFDMFGIRFSGHPDLRRILLYPEFEGHPLRKDYPADRVQPLVAYRDAQNTDKLPPFGPDEGMAFGRRWRDFVKGEGQG